MLHDQGLIAKYIGISFDASTRTVLIEFHPADLDEPNEACVEVCMYDALEIMKTLKIISRYREDNEGQITVDYSHRTVRLLDNRGFRVQWDIYTLDFEEFFDTHEFTETQIVMIALSWQLHQAS